MKTCTPRFLALATAALSSLVLGASARAELIYGVTTTNSLLSFDSNTPGTVSAAVPITGTTGGETIIDIDYFALNQGLYGIGASGTLYSINRLTGVATTDVANAAVGTAVSIDFNPMANRLRIISADPNNVGNANQNYRLTPSTGGASAGTVTFDGMLAYATGDTRAGATPNLVGSAYTNNVNGGVAASTTLYSIDNPNPSGQGFLVVHTGGPQFSTLQTVAGLSIPAFGLNAFDPVTNTGFDISGTTGLAYVSEDLGTNGERLFILNLSNGVLTPADSATGGLGQIGTTLRITSIAVYSVPEPGTWALCALALTGVVLVAHRRRCVV